MPKPASKRKRGQRAVSVTVLLGIVLVVLVGGYVLIPGSVLPSFEGDHAYIYGFQPANSATVYTANDPDPCYGEGNCPFVTSTSATGQLTGTAANGISWDYSNTQMSVKLCTNAVLASGCTTLSVTISIQPDDSPVTGSDVVDTLAYTTANPYNSSQTVNVSGQVVEYNVQVNFRIQSGSDINLQFKNDQIAFGVYGETWNNYHALAGALALPNGTALGAWSAPVEMVLANGQEESQAPNPTNDALTPDYHLDNQIITLYSTPQASSTIPGFSSPGQAQNLLAGGATPASPDTEMQQYGFFLVTLNNFGPWGYNCVLTYCSEGDPVVQENFNLYVLQVGSYLFTNQLTKPISCGTDGCGGVGTPGPLSDLYSFLSGPDFPALLVGIAVVIILVLFGPEIISLIGLGVASRKAKRAAGG